MRIWFYGPRLAGLRTGLSFGPEDWRAMSRSQSAESAIDPDHFFIYVIKGDNGLCKIGITANPNARLAQLRSTLSFPMDFAWIGAPKGDTIAIERDAHAMLAQYRRNGEWFEVSPDAAVGAIHAAAFKRGQPVLDLDATQAERIRQIAVQQPTKSPWTFGRIIWTMVKVILGAILGLVVFGAFWLLFNTIQIAASNADDLADTLAIQFVYMEACKGIAPPLPPDRLRTIDALHEIVDEGELRKSISRLIVKIASTKGNTATFCSTMAGMIKNEDHH
jgi:T5orf172 domain